MYKPPEPLAKEYKFKPDPNLIQTLNQIESNHNKNNEILMKTYSLDKTNESVINTTHNAKFPAFSSDQPVGSYATLARHNNKSLAASRKFYQVEQPGQFLNQPIASGQKLSSGLGQRSKSHTMHGSHATTRTFVYHADNLSRTQSSNKPEMNLKVGYFGANENDIKNVKQDGNFLRCSVRGGTLHLALLEYRDTIRIAQITAKSMLRKPMSKVSDQIYSIDGVTNLSRMAQVKSILQPYTSSKSQNYIPIVIRREDDIKIYDEIKEFFDMFYEFFQNLFQALKTERNLGKFMIDVSKSTP